MSYKITVWSETPNPKDVYHVLLVTADWPLNILLSFSLCSPVI